MFYDYKNIPVYDRAIAIPGARNKIYSRRPSGNVKAIEGVKSNPKTQTKKKKVSREIYLLCNIQPMLLSCRELPLRKLRPRGIL